MMLGMREKSKVRSENGTERRRRRRSPTENGNELLMAAARGRERRGNTATLLRGG
jgi:hypothetical protein